MAFSCMPPFLVFQIMAEIDTYLDKCLQDVAGTFWRGDIGHAQELADNGIAFADQNKDLLSPRARNLSAHLHYWRGMTQDNVFKQSTDMDKALLLALLPDAHLKQMIHGWFHTILVPNFVAALDKCRHKTEKPAIPMICYLEKLQNLQILRSREGEVTEGHMQLSTQCCILAKLLWKQNPIFPKESAIVQLFEEHAALCVKLKLWDPAKRDITEILGYSVSPSPRFFRLAAEVELNIRGQQDKQLTLKYHRSALKYVDDGLEAYSGDPDLIKMKTHIDEEIRKLLSPPPPPPSSSSSFRRPVPNQTVNHKPPSRFAKPEKEPTRNSESVGSETMSPPSSSIMVEHEDPPSNLPAADESVANAEETIVSLGEAKTNKKNKSTAQNKKKRIKQKMKLVPRKRDQEVNALEEPLPGKKENLSTAAGGKTKAPRLPAETPIRVQHKPASGGGELKKKKTKRNESKASAALYADLTAQYCITYGCDVCASVKNHSVEVKTVAHGCYPNKLILQERSDPLMIYILVRPCPQGYVPSKDPEDMCEHFLNGEECREKAKCPKPHSKVEKMLWDKYFGKKIGFSRFIKDLQESPLRVRNELGRICLRHNGRYTFVCRLCFRKDRTASKKKSHKPQCSNGHAWNENRLLVFQRTNGNHEIITLDEENPSDEAEEIQKCFKELIRCRFTEDEVVDESSCLNQRQNALAKNAGKPKKRKKQRRGGEEHRRREADDDYNDDGAGKGLGEEYTELDYDSDLEDVLTVWDSDEEDCEEQPREDKSFEKDPYYKLISEAELWDLLIEDPGKYKLCNIQLDGPFAARCKVLEKHPTDNIREIEVRGRMNCGQALDGDEVVVEVKSTEVLDSKEEKVSAEKKRMMMPMIDEETKARVEFEGEREGIESLHQKTEVKIETRGVVVGITRKILNRKAYTFLCRADRYHCHLMKPLDGIAPKIHVMRIHNLNDSVAVYALQDGVPQCKKLVKLDPLRRESTLFVVRYLKWDPEFIYPLGYVSHVIHTGETIARSQQIINILHQVPTKPNPASERAAAAMDVYYNPEDETWKDHRKLFVISIDPPNCKDVDDALSIEKIGEGEFRVGVHIADVSHYVEKDDVIDKNARRRATSYYAGTGKVYGMLPARLSENILSLREGEERLVLSVFFHITLKNGVVGVVGRPEICRSVVKNRKQMTYEEAETYIDQIGSAESMQWKETDLEWIISNLQLLAVGLRKNRMGDGRFYYKSDTPFETDYPYESHRMVEEFMILTNRYIGSFLESRFPGSIPLRLQDPPNEDDLDKWKVANSFTVLRSFYFRQYASLRPENDFAVGDGNVSILMPTLDAIVSAAEAGDLKKMKTLIGSEDFHPLHLLAIVSWYGIQEKATFSCSMAGNHIEGIQSTGNAASENMSNPNLCSSNSTTGEVGQDTRGSVIRIGHFSLQLKHYVQFTSPIRRFMDIIIHRFVKAALDGEPAPYTHDEIQTICQSTNQIAIRSRRYDRACHQLKSTVLLQEPFRIPFVVENFDGNSISLTTPYLSHLRRGQRTMTYSCLLVSQKPELKDNELILTWERRFYEEYVSPSIARTVAQTHEVMELDSERHSAQANSSTWRVLQQAVKGNTQRQQGLQQLRNLQQLIQRLVDADKLRKQGLCKRLEITSEMKPDQLLVKHHVRFRQTLKRGTVLQMQVGAECLKGYLQPVCQMLQLTAEKDICLQHGRDPVKCFARLATETVATRYESADQYKRVWLPIITMEAATQAAAAGDAILCNNVPIKFLRRNEKYYGTLTLPLDFCRKRQIKIYTTEDDEDDSNDYMCIRYRTQQHPSGANTSGVSCSVQNKVWVAHVVSTRSKTKEDNGRQMVYLDFIVQHHNGPIPSELLENEKNKPCTVEFLTKSLPDRRMEAAVTAIDEASELCISIVLKTTIPRDDDIEMLESDNNYDIETDVERVPCNNGSQIKAIKSALKNPFTVIQGPPGTGKTVTGVKLIYWFAKANKRLRDGKVRPQILYCGPSNNAVDVASSLLLKYLGSNRTLKVVRVYSDMLEKKVYPIPRDASQIGLQKSRRNDMMDTEEQRAISLHHLIRKPSNTHSKKLQEFDAKFARFKSTPEKVTDKEVEDYLKLVTKACIEELPKYDVVFCTCAASSSKKMREGTQIRQIIIDECGMCMEPESQIPLVCFKEARQVVLIGDHKQLQPIVTNGMAKDLGMQKSLFERYGDQAIMLEEQYRMTRIYTKLVNHLDEEKCVPIEKIAILSQYKAQCSEIEKNLKLVGFQNPKVSTVVASQGGEWQYVILSLVRSLPRYEIEKSPSEGWCKRNMGFIIDRHQINVALTRAKIGLIIIGNKHLLRCDKMWSQLLNHYDSRRCILEVKQFIPQRNPRL